MTQAFTESVAEDVVFAGLEVLGWSVNHGLDIVHGELRPDRIIGRVC